MYHKYGLSEKWPSSKITLSKGFFFAVKRRTDVTAKHFKEPELYL
jgi:hypothetical protein